MLKIRLAHESLDGAGGVDKSPFPLKEQSDRIRLKFEGRGWEKYMSPGGQHTLAIREQWEEYSGGNLPLHATCQQCVPKFGPKWSFPKTDSCALLN